MANGSFEAPKIVTFRAGADLSAKQYRFVKFGADEEKVVACGANERAIGVLMNAPALGGVAEVAVPGGGAKLKISEAGGVTLGKLLTSDTNGDGEIADAAGEWVGAMAMGAGAQSDVISVRVLAMNAHASDA